ncbi:uroporphyrinogen-III C-methyltransferase [Nannocystaceae bacterium ST9]
MPAELDPPHDHTAPPRSRVGLVSLVGAGPWDPELLTLAGRDRLARADVVVVDYLVNPALLLHCRPDAQIVQRLEGPHEGVRLDQARINELLIEHGLAGRHVVRLKGGDPMMFGRGAEEASVLREHGVPFEFVPGVSSPIAAPESAGIPITHRDHTPSVSFVSGWEAYDKTGLSVAWTHLALSAGTLVLMMSIRNAATNAAKLIAAGRDPSTPTAVIRWGTRGIQQTLVGTLADIAERIAAAGLRPPAVMVVGDVVRVREQIAWLEQRPLHGRRIVVTRAAESSADLARRLAAAGADVAVVPCLEFGPAPADQREALERALADLADYAGVIVSSPRGAEALLEGLARVGRDVRALAGRQVIAIGAATFQACLAGGLRPDLVPTLATSEGLVELLASHRLLDRRWLQVRADEGRDSLAAALRAAGGRLDVIVGYSTLRPRVPELLLESLRPSDEGGEGFDAIVFASGRTAKHFFATLAERFDDAEVRAWVSASQVVTIGPVTAAALVDMGVRVDAVAEQPSDEAIERALFDRLVRS